MDIRILDMNNRAFYKHQMIRLSQILFIAIVLISCNHIETEKDLKKSDIEFIRKLNLLNDDERIYKFYSEFKTKSAGNFFTDKRIATYWIDEHNKQKNTQSSAFYLEIKSIDTFYNPGLTYAPYILVTKNNKSQFKVCVDGKKADVKLFFENVIKLWKLNNK